MRKTKVDYKGGMIGAERRLQMATKYSAVTPFTPDEAEAYVRFLDDRKSEIKILRKKFSGVLGSEFPAAQIVYEAPPDSALIGSMVRYLRDRAKGREAGLYSFEEAIALDNYVQHTREHLDCLYDLVSVTE